MLNLSAMCGKWFIRMPALRTWPLYINCLFMIEAGDCLIYQCRKNIEGGIEPRWMKSFYII